MINYKLSLIFTEATMIYWNGIFNPMNTGQIKQKYISKEVQLRY
jgi:hypothetical protein